MGTVFSLSSSWSDPETRICGPDAADCFPAGKKKNRKSLSVCSGLSASKVIYQFITARTVKVTCTG